MNILILGTGNMARTYFAHFRFLNVNCKMAYRNSNSKNFETASKVFGKENLIYLEDTFNSKYDIVISCVETNSHLSSLKPFLNNTKLLLSEKPISLDFDEAKRFMDERIFVLMNRRYYDWVKPIKEEIKKHSIFKVIVDIPERHSKDNWFGLPSSIPLNSIHVFDLIHYISGGFFNSKYLNQNTQGISCVSSSKFIDEIIFNISFDAVERFSLKFYNKNKSVVKCVPIEKAYIYKSLKIIEPTISSNIREYIPVKEVLIKEQENKFINQKPGVLELCKDLLLNYQNHAELSLPDIRESIDLMNWMKNNLLQKC